MAPTSPLRPGAPTERRVSAGLEKEHGICILTDKGVNRGTAEIGHLTLDKSPILSE